MEKGELKEKEKETAIAGDFDTLRRTRQAMPIRTCNRYEMFTTDDGSDDDIGEKADTADSVHDSNGILQQTQTRKHNAISTSDNDDDTNNCQSMQ